MSSPRVGRMRAGPSRRAQNASALLLRLSSSSRRPSASNSAARLGTLFLKPTPCDRTSSTSSDSFSNMSWVKGCYCHHVLPCGLDQLDCNAILRQPTATRLHTRTDWEHSSLCSDPVASHNSRASNKPWIALSGAWNRRNCINSCAGSVHRKASELRTRLRVETGYRQDREIRFSPEISRRKHVSRWLGLRSVSTRGHSLHSSRHDSIQSAQDPPVTLHWKVRLDTDRPLLYSAARRIDRSVIWREYLREHSLHCTPDSGRLLLGGHRLGEPSVGTKGYSAQQNHYETTGVLFEGACQRICIGS